MDDFSVIVRWTSKSTEKLLDLQKVQDFVEKNVKALWIKNTFVNQDFKLNSKWIFKTIELNGRIWWFRLQIIDKLYWINWLELPFWKFNPWYIWWDLKTNYAIFIILAEKEWILKGFNKDLEEKIKNLKSLEKYKLVESKVWKKVWPAKLGYSQVWTIRLNNKNLEEFEKDYEFVKENYKKLLDLK